MSSSGGGGGPPSVGGPHSINTMASSSPMASPSTPSSVGTEQPHSSSVPHQTVYHPASVSSNQPQPSSTTPHTTQPSSSTPGSSSSTPGSAPHQSHHTPPSQHQQNMEMQLQNILTYLNIITDLDVTPGPVLDKKLKAAQEIHELLVRITTNPRSNAVLRSPDDLGDRLIKDLLLVLIKVTEPHFIAESAIHQLRKQVYLTISRIPGAIPRNLETTTKLILTMLSLFELENEENAMLILQIIIAQHRTYKPSNMTTGATKFFEHIRDIYRALPNNVARIFETRHLKANSTSVPPIVRRELRGCPPEQVHQRINLEEILESVFTSSTLTDAAPSVGQSSDKSAGGATFTVLPYCRHSLKILADVPLAIVLMYQLYQAPMKEVIQGIIPAVLPILPVCPSLEARNHPILKETYIDFISIQIKAISFIAYIAKEYKDVLESQIKCLVDGVVQLFENCPPEAFILRRETIVATRHILFTDLSNHFKPCFDKFLNSEDLLVSTGFTPREMLRHLVYSVLADYVHKLRATLSLKQLVKSANFFARGLFDDTFSAGQIQVCCKLIQNLVTGIATRHDAPANSENAGKCRDILLKLLQFIVNKLEYISKTHIPALRNRPSSTNAGVQKPSGLALNKKSSTLSTASAGTTVPTPGSTADNDKLTSVLAALDQREAQAQQSDRNAPTFRTAPGAALKPVVYTVSDLRNLVKTLVSAAYNIVTGIQACSYKDAPMMTSGITNVRSTGPTARSAGGVVVSVSNDGSQQSNVTAPGGQQPAYKALRPEELPTYINLVRYGAKCLEIFSPSFASLSNASSSPSSSPVVTLSTGVSRSANASRRVASNTSSVAMSSGQSSGGSSNVHGSSSSTSLGSSTSNPISAEDKEALDFFPPILSRLTPADLKEVLSHTVDVLVAQMQINPTFRTVIISSLLVNINAKSLSPTFGTVILHYLLTNLDHMGSSVSEVSATHFQLLKHIFSSVSMLAAENEPMLEPHLKSLVNRSFALAITSLEPTNYFQLLRALFRSIGGGSHENLYLKFYMLLPSLYKNLNRLQAGQHRPAMRDLFIELCLTVPVRLSSLIPNIHLLMGPIVSGLNGSQPLMQQGLRTLELCVDNLQIDFFSKVIQPFQIDLIHALYNCLRAARDSDIAHTALKTLGKLGAPNREHICEGYKLEPRKMTHPSVYPTAPNSCSSVPSSNETVLPFAQCPPWLTLSFAEHQPKHPSILLSFAQAIDTSLVILQGRILDVVSISRPGPNELLANVSAGTHTGIGGAANANGGGAASVAAAAFMQLNPETCHSYQRYAWVLTQNFLVTVLNPGSATINPDDFGLVRRLVKSRISTADSANSLVQTFTPPAWVYCEPDHGITPSRCVQIAVSGMLYAANSSELRSDVVPFLSCFLDFSAAMLLVTEHRRLTAEIEASDLNPTGLFGASTGGPSIPTEEPGHTSGTTGAHANHASQPDFLSPTIIIDGIVQVMSSDSVDTRKHATYCIHVLVSTCRKLLHGDSERLFRLSFIDHLTRQVLALLYTRAWFCKIGGCQGLIALIRLGPFSYCLRWAPIMIETIFQLLVDISSEISYGAGEVANKAIPELLEKCFGKKGDSKSEEEDPISVSLKHAAIKKLASIFLSAIFSSFENIRIPAETCMTSMSELLGYESPSAFISATFAPFEDNTDFYPDSGLKKIFPEALYRRNFHDQHALSDFNLCQLPESDQLGLFCGLSYIINIEVTPGSSLYSFTPASLKRSVLLRVLKLCSSDATSNTDESGFPGHFKNSGSSSGTPASVSQQSGNVSVGPVFKQLKMTAFKLLANTEVTDSEIFASLDSTLLSNLPTDIGCLKVDRCIYKILLDSIVCVNPNSPSSHHSIRQAAAFAVKSRLGADDGTHVVPDNLLSTYASTAQGWFRNPEKLSIQTIHAANLLVSIFPCSFSDENVLASILSCLSNRLDECAKQYATNKLLIAGQMTHPTLLICGRLLNLIACLPKPALKNLSVAKLVGLILSKEKTLRLKDPELFREPLLTFLNRMPEETVAFFLSRKNVCDPCLQSVLIWALKRPNDEASAAIRQYLYDNPDSIFRVIFGESCEGNDKEAWSTIELTSGRFIGLRIIKLLLRQRPAKLSDELSEALQNGEYSSDAESLIFSDWLKNEHANAKRLIDLVWRDSAFMNEICKVYDEDSTTASCCLYPSWKIVDYILAFYVSYLKNNPDEVDIFFRLCSSFLYPTANFCRTFRRFLNDIATKVFDVAWKRKIFFRFVEIYPCDDPSEWHEEVKAKILQMLIIPSFLHCFESGVIDNLIGGPPAPESDSPDNVISVLVTKVIENPITAASKVPDSVSIFLLQLACLLVDKASAHIHDSSSRRQGTKLRRLMTFAWPCLLPQTSVDPTLKYHGHILLSHIIVKFAIHKKIVLQVFNSLLKAHHSDALVKTVLNQSLNILVPVLPSRLGTDGYADLMQLTQRVILDEWTQVTQVAHVLQLIVKHYRVYFAIRHKLVDHITLGIHRLFSANHAMDMRRLSVDMCELIIKWELMRKQEELQQQSVTGDQPAQPQVATNATQSFDKHVYDIVFNALIRTAVQILVEPPSSGSSSASISPEQLHKRCTSLLRTALSNDLRPDTVLRLSWLENHVGIPPTVASNTGNNASSNNNDQATTSTTHLVQSNVSTGGSGVTAATLMANQSYYVNPNHAHEFITTLDVLSQMIPLLPLESLRHMLAQIQKSLSACFRSSNTRIIKTTHGFLQRLLERCPPEKFGFGPDSQQMSASSVASPHLGGTAYAQAFHQPGASVSMRLHASGTTPDDPVTMVYAEVMRVIQENLLRYEKSTVDSFALIFPAMFLRFADPSHHSHHSSAGNQTTTGTSAEPSRTYCFTDCVMPLFMRVLQKLVKEHIAPSSSVSANEANSQSTSTNPSSKLNQNTSDLITCGLDYFKPRVYYMSAEMQRDFFVLVLSPLLDKSASDIKIIRAITKIVEYWVTHKANVLVGGSSSKMTGMHGISSSASSGGLGTRERSQIILKLWNAIDKKHDNDEDLVHQFLSIVLAIYRDDAYKNTDLVVKLEPAFLQGLRSSSTDLQLQFCQYFSGQIPRSVFQRLMYVICSQNWESMGHHYWIKQCVDLMLQATDLPGHMARPILTICFPEVSLGVSSAGAGTSTASLVSPQDLPDKLFMSADGTPIEHTTTPHSADSTSPYDETVSTVVKRTQLLGRTAQQKTGTDVIVSLTELCHLDTALAHSMWIDFLPKVWKLLSRKQQHPIMAELQPFLASGSLLKQRSLGLSSVHTFASAALKLSPGPPKLAPALLLHLAENHGLWYEVMMHLEQYVLDNAEIAFANGVTNYAGILPAILPSTVAGHSGAGLGSSGSSVTSSTGRKHKQSSVAAAAASMQSGRHNPADENEEQSVVVHMAMDVLTHLYNRLGEQERHLALWTRRARYPETVTALNLETHGLLDYAQHMYELAMGRKSSHSDSSTSGSSVVTGTAAVSALNAGQGCVSPQQASEFRLWENQWIQCAKNLNQYDILMDYCAPTGASIEGFGSSGQASWTNPILLMQAALRKNKWDSISDALSRLAPDNQGCLPEDRWKVHLFSGYHSLHSHEPSSANVTRFQDDAMTCLLGDWQNLPRLPGPAHIPLLQGAQMVVELGEAATMANALRPTSTDGLLDRASVTRGMGPSGGSEPEDGLKTVTKTWHQRLPHLSDSLSYCTDIDIWRQHYYELMRNRPESDVTVSSQPSQQAVMAVHESVHAVIQLSRMARKHMLMNVAWTIMLRVHVLPKIPLADCFRKVRQQVKCYLQLGLVENRAQLQLGLEVLDSSRMDLFQHYMRADLYNLKGQILNGLGRQEEASRAFSASLQMAPQSLENRDSNSGQSFVSCWANWGEFLEGLYIKEDAARRSSAASGQGPAPPPVSSTSHGETLGVQAINCFWQALQLQKESKGRKIVPHILWLLANDTPEMALMKTFSGIQSCGTPLPSLHRGIFPSLNFIFWVPKFIQRLTRPGGHMLVPFLARIARSYPQTMFQHLRPIILHKHSDALKELLSSLSDGNCSTVNPASLLEMLIEKVTSIDSSAARASASSASSTAIGPSVSATAHHGQPSTASSSLTEASESGDSALTTVIGPSSTPSNENVAARSTVSSTHTLASNFQNPELILLKDMMNRHPVLLTVLQDLFLGLTSLVDDPDPAQTPVNLVSRKLERLHAQIRSLSGRCFAIGFEPRSLEIPCPVVIHQDLEKLYKATERGCTFAHSQASRAVKNDPAICGLTVAFEKLKSLSTSIRSAANPVDFAPGGSITLNTVAHRLKTMQQECEAAISNFTPDLQLIADRCPRLARFSGEVAHIELPDDFAALPTTLPERYPMQHQIFVQRFLPVMRRVRRQSTFSWQITVLCQNGKLRRFTLLPSLDFETIQRQINMIHLQKLLTMTLTKNRETCRRFLRFTPSALLSLSDTVRMTEDFPHNTSLLDAFSHAFAWHAQTNSPPYGLPAGFVPPAATNAPTASQGQPGRPPKSASQNASGASSLPYSHHSNIASRSVNLALELEHLPLKYFERISSSQAGRGQRVLCEVLKDLQNCVTPVTVLRDWVTQAIFPTVTQFYVFRRKLTQQLSLLSATEYCLHLTSLSPNELMMDFESICISSAWQTLGLNTSTGELLPQQPVPFRITPALAHLISPMGVWGPFTHHIIATARCYTTPQSRLGCFLRTCFLHDLLLILDAKQIDVKHWSKELHFHAEHVHEKVRRSATSTGLEEGPDGTATPPAAQCNGSPSLDDEVMTQGVNLAISAVSCVSSRVKELVRVEDSRATSQVTAAQLQDNLCRMPPWWMPWL